MKKKRKGLMILYVVSGVLVVVIVGAALFLMIGQNVRNATFPAIDLSMVPDGTYKGAYSGGRFSNSVNVTVTNGRITNIQIVKDMIVSLPGISEQLFKEVEQEQKLDVDTVSGATVSCKAYLKSVEDALAGN